MTALLTRCRACGCLRYHSVRLKCIATRYVESIFCTEAHLVTVADLDRFGSCQSFSMRDSNPKEEVQQEQGEREKQSKESKRRNTHTSKEKKMPIKAPVSADRKPITEGSHPAVCSAIFELGTQHSTTFNSDSKQILFCWELVDEQREFDGETYNARVSKTYTQSMNQKSNLRRMVESWRGSMSDAEALDFDISSLAGQPCLVSTTNTTGGNGKTYASVVGVFAIPRGMVPPQSSRPPIVYEAGNPLPDDTPKWIAEKIAASPEYCRA